MTAEPKNPYKVFYSYAHKDEKLRKELGKHLYPLKQQGLIVDWHDRDISAGTEWEREIETNLNSADIILLLISPDFMASDYCTSIEMRRALERHDAGEARVIPVILKPVDWQGAEFGKLQMLPKNAKPVIRWPSGEGFVQVAKGLREVIKELPTPTSSAERKDDAIVSAPTSLSTLPDLISQVVEPELEPVWNVPVSRNPYFRGRDQLLQRLRDMLTIDMASDMRQPVVLSGIGGMGKTQTAVEYANHYRNEYHVVLWARADSQETLISDLASFASLLHILGGKEQDQQYATDAVKHWLEAHPNWLLVLDNVEDITMVYEYLPKKLPGHVLLTSRTQVTYGKAQCLEVEKLTPEEAALLLLHRAGRPAAHNSLDDIAPPLRTQVTEIVSMLDGLPLAIDQAGAYIEETGASFSNYLEMYGKRRSELLSLRGGLSSGHPDPVATTWSLSFEKVKQENIAAAELLRLFAFLHPDAIPDELITKGATHLGTVLQTAASDLFELQKAIKELYTYSLIRRNPDDITLRLHRLVQAVLKDQMDEQTQQQWAERTVKAVNDAFPEVEFNNWQACQLYLPQAQVCSTMIDQGQMSFLEAAQLLHKAGKYLTERASYKEAEPLLKQALAIREQVLGSKHPDVATTLNELAEVHRKQGRYNEALPHYKRALAIREQVLGPEHPDVATSLNNLARPYQHLYQFTEAEPLYKRALAIREQGLGTEHPDTAQSLNDLATLYRAEGQFGQAEPLFKRALSIREQVLGPEHPDTAQSLSNLAELYREQGLYEQAESLSNRALAIHEQILGPNHPDTATTLSVLALIYRDQGWYGKAEPFYNRALAIYEQVLGPNHPNTATSLNNLATLYIHQNQYVQAEQLFKQALAIREQGLGHNHPETAITLNDLGTLYTEQSQYVQAKSLFKQALAIYEQGLGHNHPEIATTLTNLAMLHARQRHYSQAEALFQQALAIFERVFGPEHFKTEKFLKVYQAFLATSGHTRRAEEIKRRLKKEHEP